MEKQAEAYGVGTPDQEVSGVEVAVYALATWRLSSLLTAEPGPFKAFQRIREMAGIRHDEDGRISMTPDTFAAGVLSCIWCLSVWVGAVVAAAAFIAPAIAFWVCLPFALSGAAIAIDSIVRRQA